MERALERQVRMRRCGVWGGGLTGKRVRMKRGKDRLTEERHEEEKSFLSSMIHFDLSDQVVQ